MTFTVNFGWWLAPAMVTLVSILLFVFWKGFWADEDAGSSIGAQAVSGLLDLLVVLSLLVVDLLAWLIWAVAA